jgi:hypothetical protein
MSLTVTRLCAPARNSPADAEGPPLSGPNEMSAALIRERLASESLRIATDAVADTNDALKPFRGFVNGVLLAVPLWCVVGFLTLWFLGR